jgi:hypothetical protein
MADVTPISRLVRPADSRFPSEVDEIMEELGVKGDDQFTSTTRYTIRPRDRARVAKSIRARLAADDAERFLALMDELGWDVSFLVDGY